MADEFTPEELAILDEMLVDVKAMNQRMERMISRDKERAAKARQDRWDRIDHFIVSFGKSTTTSIGKDEYLDSIASTSEKNSSVEADQALATEIPKTLEVVTQTSDLNDELLDLPESPDVRSFTEGNRTPMIPSPWSTVVLADASSMTTKMDDEKILMESVIPRQRGKEIVAAELVWVSRRSLNPQPPLPSFDSRLPRERSWFSPVTELGVFDIPDELPPPEPPDRVSVSTPPLLEPSHLSSYGERNGLWPILVMILRPPAKPPDCGRRAELTVTAVIRERWQLVARVEWDGYQRNLLPKKMGPTQPNSTESWASSKSRFLCSLNGPKLSNGIILDVAVLCDFILNNCRHDLTALTVVPKVAPPQTEAVSVATVLVLRTNFSWLIIFKVGCGFTGAATVITVSVSNGAEIDFAGWVVVVGASKFRQWGILLLQPPALVYISTMLICPAYLPSISVHGIHWSNYLIPLTLTSLSWILGIVSSCNCISIFGNSFLRSNYVLTHEASIYFMDFVKWWAPYKTLQISSKVLATLFRGTMFLEYWFEMLDARIGPYLLENLVQYLNGENKSKNGGYILAKTFTVAKLVEWFSMRHWMFKFQQVGVRMHSMFVAMLYATGLTFSCQSNEGTSSGKIINLMTVEAAKIGELCGYMYDPWMVVLQLALTLSILHRGVEVDSLAAFTATVIWFLLNLPVASLQAKFQDKLLEFKDKRMKVAYEIIMKMRILKLQAWWMKFLSNIIQLRKLEEWLKKFLIGTTIVRFVFFNAPLLAINDNAYGFPTFPNKLESEGDSVRSMTTIKLAKVLILSTWQGILLSGLFAFLYTSGSYVGPLVMIHFIPSFVPLLWKRNSNSGSLYDIVKCLGDTLDPAVQDTILMSLETSTFLHIHFHSHDLEDKVIFNGGGNVMIPIEEKPSHQSGVNKMVREKGHVSADPIIQGINLTEKGYKGGGSIT